MKISSPYSNQVGVSKQALGYLRPAVADTREFQAGVNSFSNALLRRQEKARLEAEQKDERNRKYQAIMNYSELERQTGDLYRAGVMHYQRGDTNFTDRLQESYQNYENQFISKLDPKDQEEYRARAQELRNRLYGQSQDFAAKTDMQFEEGQKKSDAAIGLGELDVRASDALRKGIKEYNIEDGKFTEKILADYDAADAAFLKTLDAEQQQEYRVRSRAIRNQLYNQAQDYIDRKAAQRDENMKQFSSLTAVTDFELSMAEKFDTLARETTPGDGTFKAKVLDLYNKEEKKVLESIPADRREEFKYRLTDVRKKITGAATEYQYKSQGIFVRKTINDTIERLNTQVEKEGTFDSLIKAEDEINKLLENPDLSEEERFEWKDKVEKRLRTTLYTRMKVQEKHDGVPEQVSATGDGHNHAAALLRKFEGFRETPYWDVNAYRTGYGSDTVTRADGTKERVTEGTRTTRAEAEQDLKRRIGEFEQIAAKEVGLDAWGALDAATQGALLSVTYNYGNLPNSVAAAVRSGNKEKIAAAVANLSANPGRRKAEAAHILGGKTVSIDDDPRFDRVPLEDRISAQADAERRYKSELAAQQSAALDAYKSSYNSLLTDLYDKKIGQTELDSFRTDNPNMDFDDIKKAQKIIDDQKVEADDSVAALAKINNSGAVWSPTSEEDRKYANVLVGDQGIKALEDSNQDYVNQRLIPLVDKTGMMPSGAAGTLAGMARLNDPKRVAFAYGTLEAIRDRKPAAFEALPDDLKKDVDLWSSMKEILPTEQLLSVLRGGNTAQERKANEQLKEDAKKVLTDKANPINAVDIIRNRFEGYVTSLSVTGGIMKEKVLANEFNSIFPLEYARSQGNKDVAVENTIRQLERNWGSIEVSGRINFMKYPPNKVGYEPYKGSYEYIEQQAKRDLGLKQTDTIELISDAQTEREYKINQARSVRDDREDRATSPLMSVQRPSYVVAVERNGVMEIIHETDDRGQRRPARVAFEISPPMIEQQESELNIAQKKALFSDWMSKIYEPALEMSKPGLLNSDPTRYNEVLKDLELQRKEKEKEIEELENNKISIEKTWEELDRLLPPKGADDFALPGSP